MHHRLWPPLVVLAIVLGATRSSAEPLRLRPIMPPLFSMSADAYGGFGLDDVGAGWQAHALGGGTLRFRPAFLEIGGYTEIASLPPDQRTSVGGLIGAWLPFQRWLDVELVAGLGRSVYENPDRRFGPRGYRLTGASGTLRFGISGRSAGIVGARVGSMLVASLDFAPHQASWRYVADERTVYTGERRVGGLSITLVMTLGFDVRTAPRR